MIKRDLYETQNLYEASFLLSKGFQLAGKRRSGSKYSVLFSGKDVQQEALKFYNNQAKVDPKQYADSYRTLKDFLFERNAAVRYGEEADDARA